VIPKGKNQIRKRVKFFVNLNTPLTFTNVYWLWGLANEVCFGRATRRHPTSLPVAKTRKNLTFYIINIKEDFGNKYQNVPFLLKKS